MSEVGDTYMGEPVETGENTFDDTDEWNDHPLESTMMRIKGSWRSSVDPELLEACGAVL